MVLLFLLRGNEFEIWLMDAWHFVVHPDVMNFAVVTERVCSSDFNSNCMYYRYQLRRLELLSQSGNLNRLAAAVASRAAWLHLT